MCGLMLGGYILVFFITVFIKLRYFPAKQFVGADVEFLLAVIAGFCWPVFAIFFPIFLLMRAILRKCGSDTLDD